MRLHDRAKSVRGATRFLRVRMRQEDHEFLPGVARHAVGSAGELFQELPEVREDLVSNRLAVALPQRLEVVDVQDQDRELMAVPLRLLDFGLEAPVEVTFVVEGGDVVGRLESLHLAAQDYPVHDSGDLMTHEREELLALLVEGFGARMAQVDDPHRLALEHVRNGKEGADGWGVGSPVAGETVHQAGLPLLRDPGGDPPAPAELHLPD